MSFPLMLRLIRKPSGMPRLLQMILMISRYLPTQMPSVSIGMIVLLILSGVMRMPRLMQFSLKVFNQFMGLGTVFEI
jgi:hypothetical protein